MIGAGASVMPNRAARLVARTDHARGGLAVDVALYVAGALFAGLTAANASLPPHRAWGRIAVIGYAIAAVIAVAQAVAVRQSQSGAFRLPLGRGAARFSGTAARAALTAAAFVATAVVPMLVEAVQRANGRLDRAQEEVGVVEAGGARLWHTGTPYLSHDAIAALPPAQQLDAYLPYQPGMALYGLPKAWAGTVWWTDGRVWFTATLVVAIVWAVWMLRWPTARRPTAQKDAEIAAADRRDAALVRAVQAATVFPICALTIATGGDDLPVLGLSLLALAFGARGRHVAAGVTIGIAGALKLFAWPVALILIALAAATGRRAARDDGRSLLSAADWRSALGCAIGAIGIPVLALVPAFAVNNDAAVENVIRFPLGRGLVQSPAASPFPGHLIADNVPSGHTIATVLLVAAAVAIACVLIWRPPRDAGAASAIATWGLLVAILVIPSTRFGYLLYPVAYACWVPALRPMTVTDRPSVPTADLAADRTPG